MDGVLLIDKPKGWSSFDVVRKLRVISGVKKIGHAGTLDPMATGLLVVLFESATKRANEFLKLDKAYMAEITLGFSSDTDDAEGKFTEINTVKPSQAQIETALKSFIGEISQTPPQHSAIKVGGKRAYSLARKGQEVKLESRPVTIYSIKLLSYDYPVLKVETRVSSGTYIRSLARDIGQQLTTGAYLSGLVRTQIGTHFLEDAQNVQKLSKESIQESLITPN